MNSAPYEKKTSRPDGGTYMIIGISALDLDIKTEDKNLDL